MTQFIAHFEDLNGTETTSHQFRLAESEFAQAWFTAVTAGVAHISSAGAPTDVRKLRQWKIIRYHINQANNDHLLDEWIHFPQDIVENFQPFLNRIRLRAHAFELYAAANDQQSQTRNSLLRVIQSIDAFEATVDPAGYQSYLRFQHSLVEFTESEKSATITPGTIVVVPAPPQRTAYQMYRANDTTLLDKRLLRPWTSTESNYSMIILNNHIESIDPATMPLCTDDYIVNSTVPVASIVNAASMEAISTRRIIKIQYEN
jgi:hypothetical protein